MGLLDELMRAARSRRVDYDERLEVDNPVVRDFAPGAVNASTGVRSTNESPERVRDFFRGDGSEMEPTMLEEQLGRTIGPGQTRRPSVLPVTVGANSGELQFAVPRIADVFYPRAQAGAISRAGRMDPVAFSRTMEGSQERRMVEGVPMPPPRPRDMPEARYAEYLGFSQRPTYNVDGTVNLPMHPPLPPRRPDDDEYVRPRMAPMPPRRSRND